MESEDYIGQLNHEFNCQIILCTLTQDKLHTCRYFHEQVLIRKDKTFDDHKHKYFYNMFQFTVLILISSTTPHHPQTEVLPHPSPKLDIKYLLIKQFLSTNFS